MFGSTLCQIDFVLASKRKSDPACAGASLQSPATWHSGCRRPNKGLAIPHRRGLAWCLPCPRCEVCLRLRKVTTSLGLRKRQHAGSIHIPLICVLLSFQLARFVLRAFYLRVKCVNAKACWLTAVFRFPSYCYLQLQGFRAEHNIHYGSWLASCSSQHLPTS